MSELNIIYPNCWSRVWLKFDPIIGWWHVPNLSARLEHRGQYYFYTTNSIGIRAKQEFSREIPPGKSRIVLFGDSFTAGVMVDDDNTFAAVLENKFFNVEVLNFGLPASGTDQQLLIFENIAAEYQADIYVFGIYLENIARNMRAWHPSWGYRELTFYYRPKPHFVLRGDKLSLNNNPVPKEKRNSEEINNHSYTHINTIDAYRDKNALPWRLMESILKRFLSNSRNTPVIFLLLPDKYYYLDRYPNYYHQRFIELIKSNENLYILDMLPVFMMLDEDKRKQLHYPYDLHYTEFAHKIVANTVYSFIKSENILGG